MHNTVEREIKLHSDEVFKSSVEDPVVTPDKLKLALKVRLGSKTEAGTSFFRTYREESEQVEKEVKELFADPEEKPRIQASRFGRRSADSTAIRLVEVVLENSTADHQILLKTI